MLSPRFYEALAIDIIVLDNCLTRRSPAFTNYTSAGSRQSTHGAAYGGDRRQRAGAAQLNNPILGTQYQEKDMVAVGNLYHASFMSEELVSCTNTRSPPHQELSTA